MSHQRYTHPLAVVRMSNDTCPECGHPADAHGGRGGTGCSLRDDGVAGRIQQYRDDLAAAEAVRAPEGAPAGLRAPAPHTGIPAR